MCVCLTCWLPFACLSVDAFVAFVWLSCSVSVCVGCLSVCLSVCLSCVAAVRMSVVVRSESYRIGGGERPGAGVTYSTKKNTKGGARVKHGLSKTFV